MKSMSLAETAILLGLHPVGMNLFIFGKVVVSVLALGTSQGDLGAHILFPPF